MDRRSALLAILALASNGLKGEAREANISIDLNLFRSWKVKMDGEEILVDSKEVFNALRANQKKIVS